MIRLFIILCVWTMPSLAATAYQLKYPIPNGWKLVYHVRSSESMIKEYLPTNETLQDWRHMLTVLEFQNMPEYLTPREFLNRTFALSEKQCEHYRSRAFGYTHQGDFKMALGIQYCGRYAETNLGEVTLFKIIKADKMYMVQLAWRGEPFPDKAEPVSKAEMNDWHQTMARVAVIPFSKNSKTLHSTIKTK